MSTDRELLELAAKAAGIEYRWSREHEFINVIQDCKWNPLESDADSFRLAVMLSIYAGYSQGCATARWSSGVGYLEEWGDDPCAATRRAIVRAAAAMAAKTGASP